MYVDFEELGQDARIWIYQADRSITREEQERIIESGAAFVERWTAHGKDLKGSVRILHDRFLVIGVDQSFNQASGCSIDASVHFVRQLEDELGIGLLDRSRVAFMQDQDVYDAPLNQLKSKIQDGHIQPDTITFNNHITTKSELEAAWQTPVHNSWLKRYL